MMPRRISGIALIAALAVSLLLFAGPAPARAQTPPPPTPPTAETEVWPGTLTVGTFSAGTGYLNISQGGGGTLAPDSFSFSSNTYNINQLRYSGNTFYFRASSVPHVELSGSFVLRVGSAFVLLRRHRRQQLSQ